MPGHTVAKSGVLAEQMRSAVAATNIELVRQITVRCDVAAYTAGDTLDSLLGRAEKALYHAKETGRNRVTVAAQQTDECRRAQITQLDYASVV